MTTPVLADTYRWVDDNGVVNYSELKPRGVPADRVALVTSEKPGRSATRSGRGASPSTGAYSRPTTPRPAAQSSSNLSPDQQDMLRQLQETEATRQEEIAQIRADNCERSRRVLSNLTAKDRIRVRSESGDIRVMPEEERQQSISDAQMGIAQNCDA